MDIKRGEIYFADLGTNNTGSEQDGRRPVLIVQNNIGNKYSPTTIVVCITSKMFKSKIPTHVKIQGELYNLEMDSLVLCEQIKTIDKTRLQNHIATLSYLDEQRVNEALRLSLSL